MKKFALLLVLVTLGMVGAGLTCGGLAQAGVAVWGRSYNPAGNTCGNNCRWFIHDYTNADLKSWPATALSRMPQWNTYCYDAGGNLCWPGDYYYNMQGTATWIGHNYQAYVRFTCPDGHFKYTVGKSFHVADDVWNWWMGKFTFQSAC